MRESIVALAVASFLGAPGPVAAQTSLNLDGQK
jgi:hypothetical protein